MLHEVYYILALLKFVDYAIIVILVKIGWDNGLLSDITKPLPEPMLP